MEIIQTTQNSEQSRAKALGTGETPLQAGNVLLGLPTKPTPASLMDNSSVLSQPWTYTDLISQKRQLADLTVTTSSQGIIWTYQNSWQNVLNTFIKRLEPLFVMKSWTINFEFEVQSNFQQIGQMIIYYSNIPEVLESYHFNLKTQAEATDPSLNYLFQTQMPHIKVPMGQDSRPCFQLKWLSPFKSGFGASSFNVRDSSGPPDYDMGTLRMAVPWPMEVAPNVTPQLSLRIYGFLSDVTYGGYVPLDSVI